MGSGARYTSTLTVVLGLAFALVALATGCGTPSSQAPAEPTVSSLGTPKAGGTLTVASLAEPETLDPALAANSTERCITHAVYQGLLAYEGKPGEDGTRLIPCLAREVPSAENGGLSADRVTYTFYLRDRARFQPPLNRNVTARDVKYSLERMLRLIPAETRSHYTNVSGAEAFLTGRAQSVAGISIIDDATVRIRLRRPDPSFLNLMADEACSIVPEEWVRRWGEQFDRHPLGTGPFMFLKWQPGSRISLARNPVYWETGLPYVDAVECELGLTPDVALARLQRGTVDTLAYGVPMKDQNELSADPDWKAQLTSRPLPRATYLFLNTSRDPFDDPRVRRALAWALDRERLAQRGDEPLTPLWQYYPEGMPGHENGTVFCGYSPSTARQALREAGHADGLKTTLTVERGSESTKMVGAIRANLAAAGVQTRLQVLPPGRYRQLLNSPRGPALGIVTWQGSLPDPGHWMTSMCGKKEARPDGENLSRWWSPALTEQLAAADGLSPDARILEYTEAQRRVAAAVPYVPLVSAMQVGICSKQLGGYYLHPIYQLNLAQFWKK